MTSFNAVCILIAGVAIALFAALVIPPAGVSVERPAEVQAVVDQSLRQQRALDELKAERLPEIAAGKDAVALYHAGHLLCAWAATDSQVEEAAKIQALIASGDKVQARRRAAAMAKDILAN